MAHWQLEQLETALNGNEAGLKTALTRLLRELKTRRKHGSDLSIPLFSGSLRVLSRIKGPHHAELRLDCVGECAQFFYANNLQTETLAASSLLASLSAAFQNKRWARLAENFLGVSYADLGDVPSAIGHYYNAIQLARELGDLAAELKHFINLGVALNYAGLYQDAILCFRQAERLSSVTSLPQLAPTIATNLAQSYLFLGDSEAGFQSISKALELSDPPTDNESFLARTIREFTFVRLALELNRVVLAQQHVRDCEAYAAQSHSGRAVFLAAVTSALCEIHVGEAQKGLRTLERAISKHQAKGWDYVLALSLLVKGYEALQRPREALGAMRSLISYVKETRKKSLESLLALSESKYIPHSIAESDLHALQSKEADLRARAAERELEDSQIETLVRLAMTADLKEEQSGLHGYRVGCLSARIAEQLGWSESDCHDLDMAARLHDIGKLGIPDRILFSPHQLDGEQRLHMNMHTSVGAELLSQSANCRLRMAEDIARSHHEWWNGSGYPSGLSKHRIPLAARIVAVADVFDAITHGRPYATPSTVDEAISEVISRRETQFDPKVVDAFVCVVDRLREGKGDLEAYLSEAARDTGFMRARRSILAILNQKDGHSKAFT